MPGRRSTERFASSPRRRALGQHFLRNLAAADRIVDQFAPRPGEPVLEIGPGRGVLTSRLLERGALVVAIEKDERLAADLARRLQAAARFFLTVGDAVAADLQALIGPHILSSGFGKARVLANLPYSVGTTILSRLLTQPDLFSALTVMLQREVAERTCAAPGSRVYGSLSVLAQYFTAPRIKMRLSPGSFLPRPKVMSALVEMPFREVRELDAAAEKGYPAFIRTLFQQRRKTLPHNLAGWWRVGAREAGIRLGRMGFDPARRPETLAREECLVLYRGV